MGFDGTTSRHHESRPDVAKALCTERKQLVLGIGNVLLGDDGVGVRLTEQLRGLEPSLPSRYVDGGTLSFSLLSHLEEAAALLVIDAADLGAAPGTVQVFEDEAMDRFLAKSRRRSVHEVGLCDLLDMARLRDCLPPRRALLSVQPAVIDWSESLSPLVADAIEGALAQALAVLRRWNATP